MTSKRILESRAKDIKTLREIGARLITRDALDAVHSGDHHTICFGQTGEGGNEADEVMDHAKVCFIVADFLGEMGKS